MASGKVSGPARILVLGLLAVAAMTLAGCMSRPGRNSTPLTRWIRHEDTSHDAEYGPLARERIENYYEMAQTAGEMDPAQQRDAALRLEQQLRSEVDPSVRSEIVAVLGTLSVPEATAVLRTAGTDPDGNVRVAVCKAWARKSGPEAVEALAGMLSSDTDVDVRLAAARGLENFEENPMAARALGVALDENNPALQYRAVQSLRQISGRNYGDDLPKWREYARGGDPGDPKPSSIAERLGWPGRF